MKTGSRSRMARRWFVPCAALVALTAPLPAMAKDASAEGTVHAQAEKESVAKPYVRPDVVDYLKTFYATPKPPFTREMLIKIHQLPPAVVAAMSQQDLPVGDMAVIKDTSPLPVNHTAPPPMCYSCYSPKMLPVTTSAPLTTTTSPDDAFNFVTSALNATKKSLSVEIYQVTDQELCDTLERLHQNGIKVTLLVSKHIYGQADNRLAQQCYQQLTDAGLHVQITYAWSEYQYSHQKFWIVDGDTLFLSTGNWSPSDYPSATVFPVYPNPGWQSTNRDFTIRIQDPSVVAQFQKLMDEDYASGSPWQPQR